MARRFEQVAILGVGLLGGSIGLRLKANAARAAVPLRIAGVGRRRESLVEARDVGAIDSMHLDALEVVGDCDLVILATPVGAFEPLLRQIRDRLSASTLVTDVGSTKARVVELADRLLGPGARFVASHPMAGSERKGPAHSRADLFDNALCILTPTPETPRDAIDDAEGLWRSLGMRTVQLAPREHDDALARVSHLPHALACLLMNLPARGELDLAATGFADMTRLAAGDPEMWRDIFLSNRKAMIEAVDGLTRSMSRFRALLDAADARGIEAFLESARDRKNAFSESRTSAAETGE
jgi:prephenate dehydrogenase